MPNSDGLSVQHRRPSAFKSVHRQQPLFALTPKKRAEQAFEISELAMKPSIMGESLRNAAGSVITFPREAVTFAKKMCSVLHWKGFSLFLFLGWLLVPTLEKTYNLLQEKMAGRSAEKYQDGIEDISLKTPYQKSFFFLVLDHIAQASKIAFSVYIVDGLRIGLQALGYKSPLLAKVPHAYMRSAYTFWIADRIAAAKRNYVAYKTDSHPENLPSKVQLLNRIIDAAIFSAGFIAAIAAVRADLGGAAKGFVALGSFSTLIVSLATQNVASQLVSGLFIDLSDKIDTGEKVRFGDKGDGSKIEKIGWLQTEMRGPDNAKVVVPNKSLVDKEVTNLSRVKTSQVRQTLKFKYSAASKLPKLMETIKDEITKSCPELITNGSRPFRAHWTDFGGSNLEVVVDCHFNIPPIDDKYWDNRQKVLVAITRAVQKENLDFA